MDNKLLKTVIAQEIRSIILEKIEADANFIINEISQIESSPLDKIEAGANAFIDELAKDSGGLLYIGQTAFDIAEDTARKLFAKYNITSPKENELKYIKDLIYNKLVNSGLFKKTNVNWPNVLGQYLTLGRYGMSAG